MSAKIDIVLHKLETIEKKFGVMSIEGGETFLKVR